MCIPRLLRASKLCEHQTKAVFDLKLMVGLGLHKVVLDESRCMAYCECVDWGLGIKIPMRLVTDVAAWDRLWHSEIHHRWAVLMNSLMEFWSDGIMDSSELREVFHLTTMAGR